MKIAYLIESELEQLVLTPENEREKKMLTILDEPAKLEVFKGEFYHCRGGWAREGGSEESRILVMHKEETS